jgi:two-component system, OmpR family, alkaline phosphatase synthesis response regulator PhoP
MRNKGVVSFGHIVIDFDRMELRRSGHLVSTTSLELRVLEFFVDNPERVFSRAELIRAIWPERRRVNGRTVDNCISHLRHKIEEYPARPVYFKTLYGAGYKFVPLGGMTKDCRIGHHKNWTRR